MSASRPPVVNPDNPLESESGVAFGRTLLICFGVFAVLMLGLFIIAQLSHHKTTGITPIPLVSVTPTPSATPAAGTTQAVLAAQRISFYYPTSWKFTNSSITSNDGPSRVIDTATIVSPSGVTLMLRTGQPAAKGSCASCAVLHNENVSALGQNIWLNYISTDGTPLTIGSLQMSLDNTCAYQCYFPPTNLVNSGNVMAEIYDGSLASPTPHALGFFEGNNDVIAARKILGSMAYVETK